MIIVLFHLLSQATGITPLCWASANGHTDTVAALLEHGADATISTRVSTVIISMMIMCSS